jgi:putative two-component system response regulator
MVEQVLVVEDEAVTRGLLERTLHSKGYDVLTAQNGQEALDLLKTTHCQLVISDWDMPDISGLELCKRIRDGEIDRYIYFIFVTGHDNPIELIEGMDAGADDFITKPFNPAEIIVRIRAGQRVLTAESAEMTIFAMAKLAETRDPETGAHLERVQYYCKLLATHLQKNASCGAMMDGQFTHLIYQTSPLHDIGKVAIPDSILLKPGSLSVEEFEIMKTHTVLGAKTLKAAMDKYPNARYLSMAHDIALTHHEKFDGSGYPNGLVGEQIPLCGRIMAIADVYDALTSKRVYKEAFDHQIAKQIIIDDSGSHFDPVIVDAFLVLEKEFLHICNETIDNFQSISNLSSKNL